MRPLLLKCLACTALLFVGCASARHDQHERMKDNGCNPLGFLEDVARSGLAESQAPLPCMRAYTSVQRRAGQDHNRAVAVAISGGGYRAANFAIGVLLALEEIQVQPHTNGLMEVDYLSTVSGGGLAAGTYIAALHQHQERTNPQRFLLADVVADPNGDSRLRLRMSLYPYLWRALLPGMGRNEALHRRFECIVPESLTLGDIFVPNCDGPVFSSDDGCRAGNSQLPRLPYWFANATVVRNGAIFPFAPDILELYEVAGYRHRIDIKASPYEMPLAVGMTASATFPGGVPPLTLCVRGECGDKNTRRKSSHAELQLLDGGESDNLGVLTALAVLAQDNAHEKVLIVIDAYVGTRDPMQSFRDRISTLDVVKRSTSIYLDSWRSRHRYVVTSMARGLARNNDVWKVVFLSFDELQPVDPELHAAVTSVGTNFKITWAQQEALLEAGRRVVEEKQLELCEALGCPKPR